MCRIHQGMQYWQITLTRSFLVLIDVHDVNGLLFLVPLIILMYMHQMC